MVGLKLIEQMMINFSCAFSIFILLERNITLILLPDLIRENETVANRSLKRSANNFLQNIQVFVFKLVPYILKTFLQHHLELLRCFFISMFFISEGLLNLIQMYDTMYI